MLGGDRGARVGSVLPDDEDVTFAQCATLVTAERAEREGRCAAEEFGDVETTANEDVDAQPRSGDSSDVEQAARRDGDRAPLRDGDSVDAHGDGCTRHAHLGLLREPQGGAGHGGLEAGSTLVVAEATLPRRNDRSSMGPDGGTPICQ